MADAGAHRCAAVMDPRIADKVARSPTGPGVHLFTDALGGTLYVGKAADLRACAAT